MIIDFHTHIMPPHIVRDRSQYVKKDPCFAMLYSSPKARLVTAEDLIASMDECEIGISVLLNYGWMTHELCVETNDYILESVARYPGRLVGFCAVQPNRMDAAQAEIERCARAGARGIGEIRPDVQSFSLSDDSVMVPLMDAVKKYRLILLTHASEPVGHDYPGKGDLTPAVLYPFICRFPEVKLVCAHWGGGLPLYALMPEVKKVLSNVYFDTAASPFLYRPEIYAHVCQLIGPERILFGTDFPLMRQRRVIDEINGLSLPRQAKGRILAGNALELLGMAEGV